MLRFSLLVPCLLGWVACAAPEIADGERLVRELPEGADVWWFSAAPDGAAAYAERRGFDAYLVAGGRSEGPYP